MGKIAFYPLLDYGHLNLGFSLSNYIFAKYGNEHEIVFLVDAKYPSIVARNAPNVKVRIYKNPDLPDDYDPEKSPDPTAQKMDLFRRCWTMPEDQKWERKNASYLRMVYWLKKVQPEVEALLDEEKPNLILYDHLFSIPFLQNRGVPWGHVCSTNPLNTLYDDHRYPPYCSGFSMMEHPAKAEAFLSMKNKKLTEFFATLSHWFEQEGLPALRQHQHLFGSPFWNLYSYPKELAYFNENYSAQIGEWYRVDSPNIPTSVYKNENEETPRNFRLMFPDQSPERKMILFSLGSMVTTQVDILQRLLDIFGNMPYNFIVSKGVRGHNLEMPSNCVGEVFLPQREILKQVDAAILHGGNNSFCEAAYEGVPLLILPAFGDQPDNAQRLKDLKLGGRLNLFTCSAEEIAHALNHLLFEEDIIKRMKKMKERMQKEDSWEKPVTELIKILENPSDMGRSESIQTI